MDMFTSTSQALFAIYLAIVIAVALPRILNLLQYSADYGLRKVDVSRYLRDTVFIALIPGLNILSLFTTISYILTYGQDTKEMVMSEYTHL